MTAPRDPDLTRVGDLLPGALGAPAPGAPGAEPGGSAPPAGDAPVTARGPAGEVGLGQDLSRVVALVWPDVVGPEVAANAHPVQLRRRRLVVSASSSVWAQTLQLMSGAILERMNERLGPGSVEEVVFRHAGWEERPRRYAGQGVAEVQGVPPSVTASPGAAGEQLSAPSQSPESSKLRSRPDALRPAPGDPAGAPPSPAPSAPPPMESPALLCELSSGPPSAPPLTAEQEGALAAVERLDLAPELREKIIRTMKAGFVRAQQDSVR
jgi:hypothetical protein